MGILKRKTTASVLAVFTKAIADLEIVNTQAIARAQKHQDKAIALRISVDAEMAAYALAQAEAQEALSVATKIQALVSE